STASVTLTKTSGSGTVGGLPATVNAVDGVATVQVTGSVAGTISVQATSSGLTSATSSFAVVAGSDDHLTFTNSTADLASGSTRELVVEVRDANNNRVDVSTAHITIARSAGPGSVAGLPATVGASGGVAARRAIGFLGGPVTIKAHTTGLGD